MWPSGFGLTSWQATSERS
jgi:hypothetical protein